MTDTTTRTEPAKVRLTVTYDLTETEIAGLLYRAGEGYDTSAIFADPVNTLINLGHGELTDERELTQTELADCPPGDVWFAKTCRATAAAVMELLPPAPDSVPVTDTNAAERIQAVMNELNTLAIFGEITPGVILADIVHDLELVTARLAQRVFAADEQR